MAKKSDVKLKVEGLSGITPIGFSVTYQIGAIPTAEVSFAPGNIQPLKISGPPTGLLANVDSEKRKKDVTVNVEVNTYAGAEAGRKIRKLKFVGLLDGVSIHNLVGGNAYHAVLKNKAQVLLELTTVMPGLYPSSVNIYKNPDHSITLKTGGSEDTAVKAWGRLVVDEAVFSKPPIECYTEIIKLIIKKQQDGWQTFCGTNRILGEMQVFSKIFEDPRYKKALNTAKEIFDKIDLSAVQGGSQPKKSGMQLVFQGLANTFAGGPTILLENYLNFLHSVGVTLIFSNTKIFAVPINSVINQELTVPSFKKIQDKPNICYPADYNSYTYNDNGYRDIATVLVSTAGYVGGTYLGGITFDNGAVAHFAEQKNQSQASGVLVVQAHPWLLASPIATLATDSKEGRKTQDQPSISQTEEGAEDFTSSSQEAKGDAASRQKEKDKDVQKQLKTVLDNYAETKFYQSRYSDRQGSITMDFNPDWVPGTSGALYVRESQMWLVFYVVSVTHRIEVGAPANGTAITIINYNCGRMGKKPPGVDKDEFLGYDKGKEQKVRDQFIQDNK
jgi:hypothetical protein